MKQKFLIVILALISLTALVSCKKETQILAIEDSLINTTEPAAVEDKNTENTTTTNEIANTDESTDETTDESIEEYTDEKTDENIITANEDINDVSLTDSTILIETPPFSYYLSDKATGQESKPVNLKIRSSVSNGITDENEWSINNNLSLNKFQITDYDADTLESLPDGIDEIWNDLIITSAFFDDSFIYSTYGSDYSQGYILNIYDAETLERLYSLDFSDYRYSPEYVEADYDYIEQKINWASIKDNILYVSHSHSTYAKSSNNMNAYITAIDLNDMSILWRTDALVCNSDNFQIVDGIIICGYGFTDEEDYMYQIDFNSGKVLDKIPLKSALSYVIKKDDVLYVHTYNTDYEYDIE